MAAPHGHQKKDLLPASAAQEAHHKVYRRCIERHLRVLDAKIASLEIGLNDELLKKSSSSSGLQEDMVINILDEIERTRAKRDAVYAANQEKINKGDGNGNGDAPPPPSAGM